MNLQGLSTYSRAIKRALLAASAFASASAAPPAIKPDHELLVTSPAVVDSDLAAYPGPWSFGTLIEELVGKDLAGDCVRDWLNTWTTPQMVNNQFVAARPLFEEKIIKPWQKRDGVKPADAASWKPKLENAPFRLLAIVNRMDLCAPEAADSLDVIFRDWKRRGREVDFVKMFNRSMGEPLPSLQPSLPAGYGAGPFVSGADAATFGEGRLVFGAVAPDGAPLPGDWTIIFEYKLKADPNVRATGEEALNAWAKTWHSLSSLELADPQFAVSLERITRRFTHRSAGCKGPTLGQIRTSEAAFNADRQFRQFALTDQRLKLTTLAQTPAPAFLEPRSDKQRLLGQFLHQQNEFILAGLHNLPMSLPDHRDSVPLLAATASIPVGSTDFHWDAGPTVSHEARRIFSLNTCTGCHAGETGCADGLHIHARPSGQGSITSAFLRVGSPLRINDPALPGSKVEFHEMEDRAAILSAFLETKDRSRLNALRDILRSRLKRAH